MEEAKPKEYLYYSEPQGYPMTINEILTLFSQACLVLITLLTLVDFFRYRDRARLDIALLVTSLGFSSFVSIVTQVGNIESRLLSTVSFGVLFLQPYFLLRLVQHFRPVSKRLQQVALAGFIGLIVIIIISFFLPEDSDLLLFPSLILFVYFEGYAAIVFIRGAIKGRGITQRRLLFVAIGTGALAFLFLVIVVAIALRWTEEQSEQYLTPIFTVLILFLPLGYYFGFATPAWLRRTWQLTELHIFLQKIAVQRAGDHKRKIVSTLHTAAARAVGGHVSTVALWDETLQEFHLQPHEEYPQLTSFSMPATNSVIGEVWHTQQPVLVDKKATLNSVEQEVMEIVAANAFFAVPITTTEKAFGVLLVFLPFSSLFPSDDINLLVLLAEQGAITLNYDVLLAEQKQLVETLNQQKEKLKEARDTLELRVQERTQELAQNRDTLAQSESLIRAILETALDGVITIDSNGKVLEFNKSATEIFGYSREEAIGAYLADLIIPEHVQTAHKQGMVRFLETKEPHILGKRVEITGMRRDGSEFPVELAINSIVVNDEYIFAGIIRDITESKKAEQDLKDSNESLAQANTKAVKIMEDLKVARDEAEAANEAKSEFLANMSHEIRTPMNAVIGMTGLLLDTPLTPEQFDFVHTIRQSGNALLGLINDILDFSKIEAGQLELEQEPFSIRACVESALDLVAAQAAEKHLDLAYFIAEGVPMGIMGDVTRLRQILVNLLGNAVKFTDSGEVVLLVDMPAKQSANQEENLVISFAVKDTGIGIAPEQMKLLFQSFSQIDASITRKYGGTGLGLAISKYLVNQMAGKIWVESEIGVGSTFHFTIQTQEADCVDSAHLQEEQPQLEGKRLLIVDDNATNRKLVRLQTKAWGMVSQEASSGAEALEILKEQADRFDLATIDFQMPAMDGLTLAETIRQEHGESLPLILLTSVGNRLTDERMKYFAAFLMKPIKSSHLYDLLVKAFAGNLAQHYANKMDREPSRYDPETAQRIPLRILLAEDNTTNQKLALLVLERLGYYIDVVSNGAEALNAVAQQPYDLIFMDMQMPEMDGLEATRRIRQKFERQPYIAAITANATKKGYAQCMDAGMNDYIRKPFQVSELVDSLEKAAEYLGIKIVSTNSDSEPIEDEGFEQRDAGIINEDTIAELKSMLGSQVKEMFPYLIQDFFQNAGNLFEKMTEATEQNKADAMRRAAHTLYSSAIGLGAFALANTLSKLEDKGDSNDLDGADALLAQAQEEFKLAREALEKIKEEL